MKKVLLLILVCLSLSGVKAQIRTGVSAYNFISDMYIGGNVGANAFLADGFSEYGFKDCYGMSESLFIGYNFTDVFGMRALASFGNFNWPGMNGQNVSAKKFGTTAISGEGLLNLSNVFDTYNLNRPFDFLLFAGGGFISREKSTFDNEYLGIFAKAGLQADYRLTFKLDLSVQAMLNVLDEKFNERIVGIPFDIFPELKVGLTYHMRTNRRFR